MSNQKKRQEQRKLEGLYEENTTKRDVQIVSALKAEQQIKKLPFDRKNYMMFYSGALWADEHPADKTIHKYFMIGFFAGMLFTLLCVAFYIIAKMEGWL